MATDAYSALFGIEYIIPRNEYDAVKSWLGKTGTVIFQVCDARYGNDRWCEVYVLRGARLRKVIYSLDDMGREIAINVNPTPEPTPKTTAAKNKVGR